MTRQVLITVAMITAPVFAQEHEHHSQAPHPAGPPAQHAPAPPQPVPAPQQHPLQRSEAPQKLQHMAPAPHTQAPRPPEERRFDERRAEPPARSLDGHHRFDEHYRFDEQRRFDEHHFEGRRFERPRIDVDVYARRYSHLPRFHRYGSWGLVEPLMGYPNLAFLSDAMLVGSYVEDGTRVYVYVIDEDGQHREIRVDEGGEILSDEIVP